MNATAKRRLLNWLKALSTPHAPGQPPKSAILIVLAALVLYFVALAALTTLK